MRKSMLIVSLLAIFGWCAHAADVPALVEELKSPDKRTKAVDQLLALGKDADAPLKKVLENTKLEPVQITFIFRVLGNIQVSESPLKLVDLTKVAPFGQDKEKNVVGDPDLLVNTETKTIVMNGEFALEQGPLEYLIVRSGEGAKLHETVVAVKPRPHDICYALLACNYTYAGELKPDGKVELPKDAGVMMSIEFEWEPPSGALKVDENGFIQQDEKVDAAKNPNKKWVRVPLEYFAWNLQTDQTMKHAPYAFTGSKFEKDTDTGKMLFMADIEKSIAACKIDPYAVLNSALDTRNVNPLHAAGYSVNRCLVPKRHAPCRVIFEPYAGAELTAEDLKDSGEHQGAGEQFVNPPTP